MNPSLTDTKTRTNLHGQNGRGFRASRIASLIRQRTYPLNSSHLMIEVVEGVVIERGRMTRKKTNLTTRETNCSTREMNVRTCETNCATCETNVNFWEKETNFW